MSLVSSAQNDKTKIDKIILYWYGNFTLPPTLEKTVIYLNKRKIECFNPIPLYSTITPKSEVTGLDMRKWKEFLSIINEKYFGVIDSSMIDDSIYSLEVIYHNGDSKRLKYWSDYSPDTISDIHKFIERKISK